MFKGLETVELHTQSAVVMTDRTPWNQHDRIALNKISYQNFIYKHHFNSLIWCLQREPRIPECELSRKFITNPPSFPPPSSGIMYCFSWNISSSALLLGVPCRVHGTYSSLKYDHGLTRYHSFLLDWILQFLYSCYILKMILCFSSCIFIPWI